MTPNNFINHSELGNMLIGAYVGELMDIHAKSSSAIEEVQYPTVSSNQELTFSVTTPFDHSLITHLMPESNFIEYPEFIDMIINMSQLVKTRIDEHQLIQFLRNFQDTDELNIYGMMINLGGDSRINPLHPFVANAIVNGSITLPETFEVIIYEMQKPKKIGKKGLEDHVTGVVNLVNFINQNGQSAKEVIKPKNPLYADIRNLVSSSNMMDFTVEFDSKESALMPNVLIPVQFAANSIITPYYGVVQSIYDGSKYNSAQCSPMFSGNIQSSSTRLGGTCTGDLSNSRYSSLRVLNGFNLSSAYFTTTVNNSVFHWIKACQLVSIELLCSKDSNVEETKEKE